VPLASKRFGPFVAEVDHNEDRPGVNCWIEHKPTGVSNSLALLEDMGEFDELPRDSDEPVRISQRTLSDIRAWVEEVGEPHGGY
jgi:hypothetical protein